MILRLLAIAAFTFGFATQADAALKNKQHTLGVGLGTFSTSGSYYGTADVDGSSVDDQPIGGGLSGFFDLSVEYNYKLKKTHGLGAILKYASTSDETAADTETTITHIVLGPVWRHFLRAGSTEFSIGGGLAYMSTNIEVDADGTVTKNADSGYFSTFWVAGASYDISDNFALGIEHGEYIAMGSAFNGTMISDWLIKGTFGF